MNFFFKEWEKQKPVARKVEPEWRGSISSWSSIYWNTAQGLCRLSSSLGASSQLRPEAESLESGHPSRPLVRSRSPPLWGPVCHCPVNSHKSPKRWKLQKIRGNCSYAREFLLSLPKGWDIGMWLMQLELLPHFPFLSHDFANMYGVVNVSFTHR